jgi:hypothetical protein
MAWSGLLFSEQSMHRPVVAGIESLRGKTGGVHFIFQQPFVKKKRTKKKGIAICCVLLFGLMMAGSGIVSEKPVKIDFVYIMSGPFAICSQFTKQGRRAADAGHCPGALVGNTDLKFNSIAASVRPPNGGVD